MQGFQDWGTIRNSILLRNNTFHLNAFNALFVIFAFKTVNNVLSSAFVNVRSNAIDYSLTPPRVFIHLKMRFPLIAMYHIDH